MMDIDKYIKDNNVGEVNSQFIKVPSSNELDPRGLFSQITFGEIGSPERMLNSGFIALKTDVLHPRIFKTLMSLKGTYVEIISGKMFARFDEKEQDFIKSTRDDEHADTGYSFFLEHVNKIEHKTTKSYTRNNKIDLINMMPDLNTVRNYPVLVAGMRDIELGDRDTYDEINKLYMSLLSMTQMLPKDGTTSPVFDSIRFSIQKKINDIYHHLYTFLKGKTGWLENKFTKRALALGSRNIISAAQMTGASPDDPRLLKYNEVMYGTYQTIKTIQPVAIYHFRKMFFDQVVTDPATKILVIDPKTNKSKYIDIDDKIKNKFISEDGLETMIKRYDDLDFRTRPITVTGLDNKDYYLFMVYDTGDSITIFRDISTLTTHRPDADLSKVRPLTYCEMFYIVATVAAKNKHGVDIRYPVIGGDSVITPKLHVISTRPDRVVKFTAIHDEEIAMDLWHYPLLGKSFVDSMIIHPSTLVRLNADYDGDQLDGNTTISDNSNKEISDHLDSLNGVMDESKQFRAQHVGFTMIGLSQLTRDILPSEGNSLKKFKVIE
ncbi:MAG: hypothetical protein GY804_09070 [Alphaproteobacteria bacterium]|nr:hypothetical protein [Alphaproteobacteria bacterium]